MTDSGEKELQRLGFPLLIFGTRTDSIPAAISTYCAGTILTSVSMAGSWKRRRRQGPRKILDPCIPYLTSRILPWISTQAFDLCRGTRQG